MYTTINAYSGVYKMIFSRWANEALYYCSLSWESNMFLVFTILNNYPETRVFENYCILLKYLALHKLCLDIWYIFAFLSCLINNHCYRGVLECLLTILSLNSCMWHFICSLHEHGGFCHMFWRLDSIIKKVSTTCRCTFKNHHHVTEFRKRHHWI